MALEGEYLDNPEYEVAEDQVENQEGENQSNIFVYLQYMRTPLDKYPNSEEYFEQLEYELQLQANQQNQNNSQHFSQKPEDEERNSHNEGRSTLGKDLNGSDHGSSKKNGIQIEEDEIGEEQEEYFPEILDLLPKISEEGDTRIVDYSDNSANIKKFSESEQIHVSFWVSFDTISYTSSDNITFLSFGSSIQTRTLQFSIKQLGKENRLFVDYIEGKKTFGKIVSKSQIRPNTKYFVNFSVKEGEEFTEVILTLNANVEASLSFKDTLIKQFTACVAGTDVSCSQFIGTLSDLFVCNVNWDLQRQKDFFSKYRGYADGERCVQIKQDQKIHRIISHKHKISGHPPRLLSRYEYNSNYKQTIANQSLVMRETKQTKFTQNTAANPADDAAMKAQYHKTVHELNMYLQMVHNEDPVFYQKLNDIYESRKWIFRSFYMYSPVVQSQGESKLKFKCFNSEIATSPPEGTQFPFFPIHPSFFFQILDIVCELSSSEKSKIQEIAEISGALKIDAKGQQFFLYDKFMHFICVSVLRPPKTHAEIAEEKRKAEIQARLEAERNAEPSDMGKDDQVQEVVEEPHIEMPSNEYTSDFFIGNIFKEALKHEFELYRKQLWRATRDNIEMIKLWGIHFCYTEERFDYIKFIYLARVNESESWEQVHEYMNGLEDIFEDKNDHRLKFNWVEIKQSLIPQRLTPSGELDDKDSLYMFQDGEKRTITKIKIDDVVDFKFKQVGDIFYSLRIDTLQNKRIRIEFKRPDLRDETGAPIPDQSFHYYGGDHTARVAIGLVDRQRNLCGFGIFEDVDKAVAVLVPEMDAEVPILNFRDVLRHYVKINANEDEEDRISQLIFKWNEERLLEVHAKGERKNNTIGEWPSRVKDLHIEEGHELEYFFSVPFLHPSILKRLEEERRKAEEEAEKEKQDKNKKGVKKPTQSKEKKETNKNTIVIKEKVIKELVVNLSEINSIRIDFYHGQICKFVFTNHDESATVIPLPKKEVSLDDLTAGNESQQKIASTDNLSKDQNGQEINAEAIPESTSRLFKIHNGFISGVHAKYKKELSDLVLWGAEEVIEKVEEEEQPELVQEVDDNLQDNFEEEKFKLQDPDSDFMDSAINLEDIDARVVFCINYFQYKPKDPPKNSKKNPEHLKKVNEEKFKNSEFSDHFKKTAKHIQGILHSAEIYGNPENCSYIGEFTVYTYAFGSPEKTVFFTNVDKKQRYPNLGTLYYMIVGELIKYDDHKLMEKVQYDYIQRHNISFENGERYDEGY